MKIIVFDTETVGCNTQTLLNVGYAIVDINEQSGEMRKICCAKDYIVSDLIKNKMLMLNDMFVGAERSKYIRLPHGRASVSDKKVKLAMSIDLDEADIIPSLTLVNESRVASDFVESYFDTDFTIE